MKKYQYYNVWNGKWEDIPTGKGYKATPLEAGGLLVEYANEADILKIGQWRVIDEIPFPTPPAPGTQRVYVNSDGSTFTLYALTLQEKNGTRVIYADIPPRTAYSDWEDMVKARPGMKDILKQ